MSTLVADMSFDFNFSMDPATPPSYYDTSLLEIPSFIPGHTRSSSANSVFSTISHSTTATEASTMPVSEPPVTSRRKSVTPARSPQAPAPIRQHGPILLPKIRSQDQEITGASAPKPAKRQRTHPPTSSTPPPMPVGPVATAQFRPMCHARSYTNPEPVFNMSFTPPPEEQITSSSLLCSPVSFARDSVPQTNDRRASSCSSIDGAALEKYGFPTYRQMPSYLSASSSCSPPTTTASLPPQAMLHPHAESFMFPSCAFPKAPSPLSISSAPEVQQPTTSILSHLTAPNPTPSLVRTISIPLRDPNTKHFWWDVRQIRPWSTFTAQTIMSLPGALATLTTPVPQSILPMPTTGTRHPETEQQLHSIYASHYIPRLNSALAASSTNPVQFSLPSKAIPGLDNLILAHVAGDSASAAAIFGGKPSARVVGLVRSFDRFNTGMRVEGNIKRVEYLRGLAALHHAMREHGCRYGFILTEIELVVCRNGSDSTPNFGYLEVTSVQLAANSEREGGEDGADQQELTACMALWGLGMMAGMDRQSAAQVSVAHWKAEIGAPAEGTRRKALSRDNWMPNPQLAEKREAKRARGWVMPEDPIGRKELGKRGVRYGAC